jgi:hypothetical protein
MRYFSVILASLLLGMLLLSCGTRDDRGDIRGQYGEPDTIRRTTVDPFWSETWIYNQQGVAFEFHRTSGCGSQRDVYLYATYPVSGKTTEDSSQGSATPDSFRTSTQPLMPLAPR